MDKRYIISKVYRLVLAPSTNEISYCCWWWILSKLTKKTYMSNFKMSLIHGEINLAKKHTLGLLHISTFYIFNQDRQNSFNFHLFHKERKFQSCRLLSFSLRSVKVFLYIFFLLVSFVRSYVTNPSSWFCSSCEAHCGSGFVCAFRRGIFNS